MKNIMQNERDFEARDEYAYGQERARIIIDFESDLTKDETKIESEGA